MYGCSQPRELWFIDFNHVYICRCSDGVDRNRQEWVQSGCALNVCSIIACHL